MDKVQKLNDYDCNDTYFILQTAHIQNDVVWDIKTCGSCKNLRFGVTSVLTRA
jgi:hypothetical protein